MSTTTNDNPLGFDPATLGTGAPANSRWVPPTWMVPRDLTPAPTHNGLGHPWDPLRPSINGIDLTRPDPRIKIPAVEIKATSAGGPSTIAFVDVNILDSTGSPPYRGDVLIKGERIVHVGGKLSEAELLGARVIQGRERTLMSGMIDAHTHFTWNNASDLAALATLPVEEHTIFSVKSAKTFLDCGYTMCVGAASAKDRLDLAIRNAIHSGEVPGPRFLANGKEMAPMAGSIIPGITRFVENEEEIIHAINEMADMGIDQCKFSMSGEEITETLRAEDTTFPDALVAAGVEAAHARGMRVCSHARSDDAIRQCLQYGVDIIYHASFISDATMDALEAQKHRVVVAPALNWLVGTLCDAEKYGYPVSKAEEVGYARELAIAVAGLKEMHRRGIKILPGGDYGFAWTPHGTYRDLEHFVGLLGMTPMEAIVSATALGGELMGHPKRLGKIIPGAYADLLLVNGNPLHDIRILSHSDNLNVIVMNGRLHKVQNESLGPRADEYGAA